MSDEEKLKGTLPPPDLLLSGPQDLVPADSSGTLEVFDPLKKYLVEIRKFPLLTREEEFDLAKKWWEKKDLQAAARMVVSNLRLVVKIAFEYQRAYSNLLDLIQEGNLGLMQAVKKFDPYREVKLSSYASWWIRAYILKFLIDNWSLVKIGTTQAQKKLFYKIGKVRKALESNQENEKKYEVLAKDMDVAKEDIIEMEQRMSSRDLSLDAPFDDNQELSHFDLLKETSPNQEEVLGEEEEKKILEGEVQAAMRRLTEKEEYVIKNRIMADSPLTLQEIGAHLKLSRERVRQIENEALKKLKREMSSRVPLGAQAS